MFGVPAAPAAGRSRSRWSGSRPRAEDTTEESLLETANKALAEAGLADLAAVRIARDPRDYPLGPTGKVLKRELRTRFATLFTAQTT